MMRKKFDKKINVYDIVRIIFFMLLTVIFQFIHLPFFDKKIDFTWQRTNGPHYTEIKEILLNSKGHIFALGNGQLYRSINNGRNLIRLSQETGFRSISIVNDILFLSSNSKLFASTDDGATIRLIYHNDELDIFCIISISNKEILLGTRSGIIDLVNTNGKWRQKAIWLSGHNVYTLFKSYENNIYAGIDDGLYLLSGKEKKWEKIFDNIKYEMVYRFAEDAEGKLYVLAYNPCQCWTDDIEQMKDGLYETDRSGKNLRRIKKNMNPIFSSIAFDSNNVMFAGDYYNGIHISSDKGKHWEKMLDVSPDINVTTVAADTSKNLIYAGTAEDGMFTISQNGNKRNVYNCNPSLTDIEKIIPGTENRIAVYKTHHHLYLFNDNNNWNKITINGRFTTPWMPIIFDHEKIYIGDSNSSLFVSCDDGKTWKSIKKFDEKRIKAMAVNSKGEIFLLADNNLYKSSALKDKWILVNSSHFEKHDYGKIEIKIDSNDNIYAWNSSSIYLSKDDGKNWNYLELPNHDVLLSLTTDLENNLYIGYRDSRIYISSDNGETWENINRTLYYPDFPGINSIAVSSGNIIFIGTNEGIFYTPNEGDNWFSANNGLPSLQINSLTIDSKGYIYAAPQDNSVLRTSVPID